MAFLMTGVTNRASWSQSAADRILVDFGTVADHHRLVGNRLCSSAICHRMVYRHFQT